MNYLDNIVQFVFYSNNSEIAFTTSWFLVGYTGLSSHSIVKLWVAGGMENNFMHIVYVLSPSFQFLKKLVTWVQIQMNTLWGKDKAGMLRPTSFMIDLFLYPHLLI